MDPIAFRLLNEFQRGFPLAPKPFEEIAAGLGISGQEVLEKFRTLRSEGRISRIGPVFRPNTVGASALVALAVPADALARVAALVSAQPEVNHNYARDHRWNLWFVVAAADEARVAAAIDRIESGAGLRALRLPLEEEFHIDLGFDLETGAAPRGSGASPGRVALGEAEKRLLGVIADGLPLTAEPYRDLGTKAGLAEDLVRRTIHGWIERSVVRRFGVVVRHRPLGYAANAMAVWDVPDGEVRAAGRRLAAVPEVTLCYRRARQLPDWPYNLFCMVHGRERGAVARAIDAATRAAGLEGRAREILFSTNCFTQRGARYAHG